MVDLSYEAMNVRGAKPFEAPRSPVRQIPAAERFFNEMVFAAESLQRQGIVINMDTLVAETGAPKRQTAELVETVAWQRALEERGIVDGTQKLTPRQIAAVAVYMDMEVPRSHAQKLKVANVSPAAWAGWLRQPRFAQYLSDLSNEALQGSLPVARQRIAEQVDSGERWAIELMLKMTGNDPDQGVDLNRVLMGVFQILDEEIPDAQILERIGKKVQQLVGGGQGAEMQRQVVQLRASDPRDYPGTEPAQSPVFPLGNE